MRTFIPAIAGLVLAFASACGPDAKDSASETSGYQKRPAPATRRVGRPRQLQISTFNVLNYGASGIDSERSDARDKKLKEFVATELGSSDVIIFQEVVDRKRFLSKIIGGRYSCKDYDAYNGHQYTMVCVKKDLQFSPRWYDDNYAIEEVSMGGKLRPAVHGALKDRAGNWALYVIGVHLKASPEHSETRMQQIRHIAKEIQKQKGSLPVVIAGDFNAQTKEVAAMEAEFKRHGLDIASLRNNVATYNSGKGYRSTLDHFFLSKGITASQPKVHPVCQDASREPERVEEHNYYISDHCPVTVTVQY